MNKYTFSCIDFSIIKLGGNEYIICYNVLVERLPRSYLLTLAFIVQILAFPIAIIFTTTGGFTGRLSTLTAFWYSGVGITAISFLTASLSRVSIWAEGIDHRLDKELQGKGIGSLTIMTLRKFFKSDCFTARRLFAQNLFRGLHLVLIIWGVIVLFIGAAVIVLFRDFGALFLLPILPFVNRYLLDFGGGMVLMGMVAAVVKRALFPSIRKVTSMQDSILIGLFLLLLIQGFTLKGLPLVISGLSPLFSSPIAWLVAWPVAAAMANNTALLTPTLTTLLIIHEITALAFIAYIPFSKMFHIFASQITTEIASTRYRGYAGRKGAELS